ncbi:MAG: glycosyltransferase [Nitrososphaerales archaeon]|nr:glycosyltransferase [Nitrososphaerales archaeon]
MPAQTAVLFAPNGGHALEQGGAAYVTLLMANILAKGGYSVEVCAVHGLPRNELEALHGVKINNRVRLRYVEDWSSRRISFPPFLPSRILASAVRQWFGGRKVGVAIFGDDAPARVAAFFKAKGAFVVDYAHLPLRVRGRFPRVGYWAYEGRFGLPAALLYWNTQFSGLDEYDLTLANSRVTAGLVRPLGASKVSVLHPPARTVSDQRYAKEPIVLHAAQYGRGFNSELAVMMLKEAAKNRLPVKWVFMRSNDLPSRLRELAKRLPNVWLLGSVSNEAYRALLGRSVALLNLRFLEPFGISTVDAMSAGAVPIILKSRYNGSWIDICDEGRFGIGCETSSEICASLERLLTDDEVANSSATTARQRSQLFSLANFTDAFREVMARHLSS